jgi:hypothetical protein
MKRVFVLFIALLIAFALVGCNVAPNVPRITPYVTNGNYYNNGGRTGTYAIPGGARDYGNRTGTYKNGNSPIRSGVNAADKSILPGAGTQP